LSIAYTLNYTGMNIRTSCLTMHYYVPKTPFFRYFLPLKPKTKAQNDATQLEKFDIGLVKDLYVRQGDEETDFELMEWPG